MRIVQRETEVVQRKEITIEYLEHLYSLNENKDKLVVVYDGENYLSVIDFGRLRSIHTQRELNLYLDVECCHECLIDEHDEEWADIIFRNTNTTIIPIMTESGIQKFMYMGLPMEEHLYKKKLQELRRYLQEKGVSVFHVRMPQKDEMKKDIHDFIYFPGNNVMWRESNKELIQSVLPFFTEKKYEDAKSAAKISDYLEGRIFGSGRRRIYLVGNGWSGFEGDELAGILSNKLQSEYEIQCVVIGPFDTTVQYRILEYDIRKNDIVILMDQARNMQDSDIDVTGLFNRYTGDKWLYYDLPVHSTRYGNELLAKEILEKIICEHERGAECDDNLIVHKGEPQISYQDEELLKKYYASDMLSGMMMKQQCLREYREKGKKLFEKKMIQNIIDFIFKYDIVTMYGTGRDALGLLRRIPQEAADKLQYCDQRAVTEDYEFMGRRVMKPSELAEKKTDAGIIVSSTTYKCQIYDTLMELGMACGQILFNVLSFGNEVC